MKKDFLAGARKKRLSYTPRGLLEAWWDLDASAKVYVGTIIGLVISVRLCSWNFHLVTLLTVTSCFLPLVFSSARDASTPRMVLLAPSQMHENAAREWNGKIPIQALFNPIANTTRIPSIFVQLFWTAIVGPWILWKIRNVNDVHSWALQTRLAIFAGSVAVLFLYLQELTTL